MIATNTFTNSWSIEKFIVQNDISLQSFKKRNGVYTIRFSMHDVLFSQHKIVELWRTCNQNKLKPVAKTFLGRISTIRLGVTEI